MITRPDFLHIHVFDQTCQKIHSNQQEPNHGTNQGSTDQNRSGFGSRFQIFSKKIADHGPIRPDRSADVVFVDFLDELKTYIRALGTNSSKPSCSFLESCEIPSQISKTLACTKWHLDSRYSRCYI